MKMQIAFHLGVHATDGDRLLKALLNNRATLLDAGTEIVPPNRYRSLFDDALLALNGAPATVEMEQILMDAVLEHDHSRRAVLSNAGFMGAPGRVVGRGMLYPQMAERVAALVNLFPRAESEFFLAMRNPALLLSDVRPLVAGGDYAALMQGTDPRAMRWSDCITRLLSVLGGRRLVIWCHEDVPLIWPEIMRLAGDIDPDRPLAGALVYMHELLGDAGLPKLRAALAGLAVDDIAGRRRIFSGMLQRHALAGATDQAIDLPGWSQELVDEVSANYRTDIAQIAAMPGVEFISA